jgi:hypothetical protein
VLGLLLHVAGDELEGTEVGDVLQPVPEKLGRRQLAPGLRPEHLDHGLPILAIAICERTAGVGRGHGGQFIAEAVKIVKNAPDHSMPLRLREAPVYSTL